MSRKNALTNLENEEVLSSPVRRSTRLLNTAAAAGITTRRGSQSSDTSEPPTRTSARIRRISVDEPAESKNNQVKNTEAKTPTRRGRKSSVSSETSEKPKTTTRTRRNSASQDSSETEPKVTAPKTPSRITRRKTSTDSDISVEIGNLTRTKAIQGEKVKKSSQEISDTETDVRVPKPATIRRGRRFSNDENISTPTKTPVRRSRRLSSNTEIETEDNKIITSIDLTNTDVNEDENLNEELSANKLTTPYKKKKIADADLDLSVINESVGDLNETSLTKKDTNEESVQKNEDVKKPPQLAIEIQEGIELKSSEVPISPKKRLHPDHVDDNNAEYSPKKSPRIDPEPDIVKISTPNRSTINLIGSDVIQSQNPPTILEIINLGEEQNSSNKENIEEDKDKIIITDAPLSPIIGRSARISNVFKPNQKECSFVVEPMEVDDCSSILPENDNSVYKLDQSSVKPIDSTITSLSENDAANKISSSLLNKRMSSSSLTAEEENKLIDSTINNATEVISNGTESSDDFIVEETEERMDMNVKATTIKQSIPNILINKQGIIIKHNVNITGKTSSPLIINKLAVAGRRSYERTSSNNEDKTCNKTLSVINCSIKSKSANSSPSEEFKQHLSRLSTKTLNTEASTTDEINKIESKNQIIDLTSSSENSLDDNIMLNNTKTQTPDKSPISNKLSPNSSQHQALEKSIFNLKLSESVDYDFELPSEEEINETTNNGKNNSQGNVTLETSKENLKDLSSPSGNKLISLQDSFADICNTKDATLDNAHTIQNMSQKEKSEVILTPLKNQSLVEKKLLNKSNDEIIIEDANNHQPEESLVSPLKNQGLLLEENLLNEGKNSFNEGGIIVNQQIEGIAETDSLKELSLIEENVTEVKNKEAEISLQHSDENKATEISLKENVKEQESSIQQITESQNDIMEKSLQGNNINKSTDELKNNIDDTGDTEHNKSECNNPTTEADTNDQNIQEEYDSDFDDNKKIVEITEDSTYTKLSEYIKSKSKELESSTTEEEEVESSESEKEYNEFIDGMAEEGEEDTPSEDSNQISEEGESIGSSDSDELIEDDYDDNDSFICDDEDVKLLSGEGDDLSFERQKKSRIINLKALMMADSDDDIIPNPSSKEVEIILPKKTKTIAVLEKSPSSKTKLSQTPTKNEGEEEKNVLNNSLVEAESETIKKISAMNTETRLDVPNALDSSNTVALNDSLQKKNRKASLTIQENIFLDGINDPKVSQKINDMVASFCSSVKTGEMSLNISLEYEGSAAAENVDEVLNTKKLDSSTSSVGAELIMHSEIISVDNSSNLSSEDQRTSSSVTRTDSDKSQEKQKNKLKRKLNKSVSEVYEEQKLSKKAKKSKNKVKTLHLDGAEDLGAQSYNLIDQLVTDVKNRPKRKLKPSISNPQFNISWNISTKATDDLKPSKCCTSREERIRVNPSASIKLHPKDFKNQTLADSSRVKRIDTKTLLKRKGVYGKFM